MPPYYRSPLKQLMNPGSSVTIDLAKIVDKYGETLDFSKATGLQFSVFVGCPHNRTCLETDILPIKDITVTDSMFKKIVEKHTHKSAIFKQ